LPNGWQIPNLLASTTFTLLGCTGKEPATCTPAGAWPATSLVGPNPSLASTGVIGLASPYARIAQSTTMRNATGAQVTRIALSDWVSVVAVPQQPANPPAGRRRVATVGKAMRQRAEPGLPTAVADPTPRSPSTSPRP
jgi:hypothetical protein